MLHICIAKVTSGADGRLLLPSTLVDWLLTCESTCCADYRGVAAEGRRQRQHPLLSRDPAQRQCWYARASKLPAQPGLVARHCPDVMLAQACTKQRCHKQYPITCLPSRGWHPGSRSSSTDAPPAGLTVALELLKDIADQHKGVSYADLFQLASATAIEARTRARFRCSTMVHCMAPC